MFGWLRSLFGGSVKSTGEPVAITETMKAGTVTSVINSVEEKVTDNAALAEEVVVETPKPKKATAPKAKKTTKKKAAEDLSAMTKTQLLALCKERDIAANASLKKDELIARLSA